MNKTSNLFWFSLILLLLLPSTAGKFIANIAGGLLIFLLLLPILIAGGGWIGWKIIKSKLQKCNSCGSEYFNTISECPICGKKNSSESASLNDISQPASSVTIDITPEDTSEN
tara:strand:+ start:16784 stop:17122 length:339 start_codon:yes stop_codon:yes gene_type:complete